LCRHHSGCHYRTDRLGVAAFPENRSSQNGLFTAPKVVSAVAGVDGTVTVVIERGLSAPPHLTTVMTDQHGVWLASDLASGTGPAASIFSTNPNC